MITQDPDRVETYVAHFRAMSDRWPYVAGILAGSIHRIAITHGGCREAECQTCVAIGAALEMVTAHHLLMDEEQAAYRAAKRRRWWRVLPGGKS